QNLGTLEFGALSFGLGSVSFGTLPGTRSEQTVNKGKKSWFKPGQNPGYQPPGTSDEPNGGPTMPSGPNPHDADGPIVGPGDDANDLPDAGPGDEIDPHP
ncbi:MAG TPA: hypothetical protein VF103_15250, partial [Polyangiaceae bacterium]